MILLWEFLSLRLFNNEQQTNNNPVRLASVGVLLRQRDTVVAIAAYTILGLVETLFVWFVECVIVINGIIIIIIYYFFKKIKAVEMVVEVFPLWSLLKVSEGGFNLHSGKIIFF